MMGHVSKDTGNRVYNHKTIAELKAAIELITLTKLHFVGVYAMLTMVLPINGKRLAPYFYQGDILLPPDLTGEGG